MTRIMIVAAALWGTAVAGQAPVPATKVVETEKTIAGQPLSVPAGALQVVAATVDLPQGAQIPVHMHFWARYVYVQEGELELTLLDSGKVMTFRKGQMIVEPLRLWHKGRVTRGPARLLSVEQVPPGQANSVQPPAPAGSK